MHIQHAGSAIHLAHHVSGFNLTEGYKQAANREPGTEEPKRPQAAPLHAAAKPLVSSISGLPGSFPATA